jgi:alkylation response protein AidB-like acyl-CoA dehydrogenase
MDFELTEEQSMLQDMAKQFAEREMLPTLRDYERQHKMNYGLIKKMADQGLLAIHMPAEYGGGGLDYVSAVLVWEQLARISWTQTLASLGYMPLAGTIIVESGSEEQKQKYLPPLCRGDIVVATAAVEPNVGSDAASIETTAKLDGDYWIINGSKNFITFSGIADVVFVLATTDKSKGTKGIVLIAVDKDTPGYTRTPTQMVGGWTMDMCNINFSDCRVPRENIIGEVGRGLQNNLVGIDSARLFVATSALGVSQGCLDACVKYSLERSQFGNPLASYQLIQETLARMSAEIQAIRWQVYYAAYLKSKKLPHTKELSAAKWLASELAVKTSAEAIRLHGAYGCTDDFPVERHYRDSVLTTILGGTTEMHKLMIGRSLTGINAISK